MQADAGGGTSPKRAGGRTGAGWHAGADAALTADDALGTAGHQVSGKSRRAGREGTALRVSSLGTPPGLQLERDQDSDPSSGRAITLMVSRTRRAVAIASSSSCASTVAWPIFRPGRMRLLP
jgi:hypothetical protein